MKRVDECIQQLEFMEQELLSEEQKRIFRIAYNMGFKDGEQDMWGSVFDHSYTKKD